jgi:NAD(P)-dependent dehydrogenase (short-subunit alcohol dehydrogenase family)
MSEQSDHGQQTGPQPDAHPRPLAGKRVLLIGASAGIGRALAIRLVQDGAQVIMSARRGPELAKVAAEAGGGIPVQADITSAADCARLGQTVRDRLGQVDILVSSVGVAVLRMMADTEPADWRQTFETNVIGFHQVLRACLPSLVPDAIVAAMSSESVDEPRAALGAYSASKVALERALTAWRTEHPGFRFCRIRVGATTPTEFSSGFDMPTLVHALGEWAKRGLAQDRFMTPAEVAGTIAGLLTVASDHPGTCLDEVTVRSPAAVVATHDEAIARRAEAISQQ